MNFLSRLFNLNTPKKESADYLFHYTDKLDHLVSIMNNYFMPFYCMESIEYLKIPLISKHMAFPVVCFCDLPFSKHDIHKAKFGGYGIGMKKEWGIENHLTPVVYYHTQSITSSSLRLLINLINEIKCKLSEDRFHICRISLSILLMMFKPYNGKQYNKTDKTFAQTNTRFYDEIEWRYIPLKVDGLKLYLEMADYHNIKILDEENKKIQKNNRMEFGINDVGYLFFKSKAEIEPFISKLRPKYK